MVSNNTYPFVSVIIPTLNRHHLLTKCLRALENQSYPSNSYEIIVVDNGSDKSDCEVNEFKHVQLTCELQKGSYAARNKGISLSKGSVIAFTDSDCIPTSDWIKKGVAKLLSEPRCGLVAGHIKVCIKNPRKPTAVELYDSLYGFPQKKYIHAKKYRFGVTANLFTFKHVIEKIGAFDTRLKSGGDWEWSWRVHSAAYCLTYAEDACVIHPALRSFDELHKKAVRVILGHHELKKRKIYSPIRFIAGSVVDLLAPFRSIPYVLVDERLRGWEQRCKVILVMILIRYIKGWTKMKLQLGERFQNSLQLIFPKTFNKIRCKNLLDNYER